MNKQTRHRFLLTAAITAAIIQSANAQNEQDALRFSFLQPQGTARSIGFGNALGSVGGDYSSLSVNPAGIGIYRRSEIMVTPSLMFSNTASDYAGNSAEESGSHFSFSNIGLVVAGTENKRGKKQRSGWSPVSFGFGINRLADFTRNYSYEGRNTTSSGSFVFESNANRNGLSNDNLISTPGDLGYQSYLLDTAGNGYLSVVYPTDSTPVSQSVIIKERGGISELGLTIGSSYNDKFIIGGTLGIPIVRYIRNKTFDERDLSGNNNNDFDNFRYSEDLKTNGAGINLKLGFIYKPTDNFRIGAAIHTPTYYSLTDISNLAVTANTEGYGYSYTGNEVNTAVAAENQYDYNLTTPWRAVVSATALFGGHGFFTVDYEYVNYASARFKFGLSAPEKDYQREVNDGIKSTYQGASNIRTGLEVRLDNFMLRGGFGYYGNPYKSGNPSAERIDISGGIGFRFENVFLDLGFVHHQYKLGEQPYRLPDTNVPGTLYSGIIVPTASLSTGANNAVVTLGFKL